ncbi:MAG TPA: hypothetical protein VFJ91_06325 [Gaiellaceae bacterium]|nr:hypothetical protein [Gaiellaceae bacterium]
MTARPSPDSHTGPVEREGLLAALAAEPSRREPAVRRSNEARAGLAEGVIPAPPPVDDLTWWAKQLGLPLEAA